MNSNNQKEKDVKSKIEKIRIDLERKLATLEAIKLKKQQKLNSELEINKNLENSSSFVNDIIFEINGKIENIEESTIITKKEETVKKVITPIIAKPRIATPIKPIQKTPVFVTNDKEVITNINNTEEKNSKLNYIIYGLLGVVVLEFCYLNC